MSTHRFVNVVRLAAVRSSLALDLHTDAGERFRTLEGDVPAKVRELFPQTGRPVRMVITLHQGRVVDVAYAAPLTEADEMLARLRVLFPQGSTVTTVVRHVSQSGMQRAISVLHAGTDGIDDVSWMISRAGLFKNHTRQPGLKVDGAGMDMAYHVVYTLAGRLYGDGYALQHRSI